MPVVIIDVAVFIIVHHFTGDATTCSCSSDVTTKAITGASWARSRHWRRFEVGFIGELRAQDRATAVFAAGQREPFILIWPV
jgi:hypothetical protein